MLSSDFELRKLVCIRFLYTWDPFLESPEIFSGPKSHWLNYDLLIL